MSHVILSVVGARPNFMKAAPVARALRRHDGWAHHIVHTGQHYDPAMSGDFFHELELPPPLENLEVGSGSHAQQTASIMQRLEPVYARTRPELVIVYGDVNSTLAATLVACKLGIPVAHVEAGLRSGDRSMPEEINRLLTDRIADHLFAPSRDAVHNLLAEGVEPGRVHFVGNVMIDTLVASLPQAQALNAPVRYGVAPGGYCLVTLHRPANVDDPATLRELCDALVTLSGERTVLFPVHPRTRARLAGAFRARATGRLRLLEPLGYREIVGLVLDAAFVITDSGGLQEETSYLGVPCLTVRPNTERPITCTQGTNRLVAPHGAALLAAVRGLAICRPAPAAIEGWDGRAAQRIAAVVTGAATPPPAGTLVPAPVPPATRNLPRLVRI